MKIYTMTARERKEAEYKSLVPLGPFHSLEDAQADADDLVGFCADPIRPAPPRLVWEEFEFVGKRCWRSTNADNYFLLVIAEHELHVDDWPGDVAR